MAKNITHLNDRMLRNQADTDLIASCLMAIFHSTRRCYLCMPSEGKNIHQSPLAMNPVSYDNRPTLQSVNRSHSGIKVMGVTKHFLFGCKALYLTPLSSQGTCIQICQSHQDLTVPVLNGPRYKPNFNGLSHSHKLVHLSNLIREAILYHRKRLTETRHGQ